MSGGAAVAAGLGPDRPARARRPRGAARTGVAILVLLGAAAVAAAVLTDVSRRALDSVRVAGEFRHVSRAALEAAVAPHLDRRFFAVDVDAVREAAASLPWVRTARVRRVWPGSLQIVVEEREAVARWNADALVEADGEVFRPGATAPAGAALPRLSGPSGQAERVLARWRWLEQRIGRGRGAAVIALALSDRGEWRAELANGVTLVFDEADPPPVLERRVAAVPGALGARFGEAERIDLRYGNGFAVRWREGDGGDDRR